MLEDAAVELDGEKRKLVDDAIAQTRQVCETMEDARASGNAT